MSLKQILRVGMVFQQKMKPTVFFTTSPFTPSLREMEKGIGGKVVQTLSAIKGIDPDR